MSAPSPELFPNLDPPEGGPVALKNRLLVEREIARREASGLPWSGASAMILGCALLVMQLAPWPTSPQSRTPLLESDHPFLARLGVTPGPEEKVSVPTGARSHMALERIPGTGPKVALYLVGSVQSVVDPAGPLDAISRDW